MQADTLITILGSAAGYAPGGILLSSGRLDDASALKKLIEAMTAAGATGWVARQSGVTVYPGEAESGLGDVLEAELGTKDETLQIRRLDGGWVWTRLTEEAGGGRITDEVCLVTTHGKAARYRRYWSVPADGATEIVACRLIGLEDIGGKG
ncbi:MAG: hypothetical protein ACT4OK_16205 [Gemmobacter sp.]